MRKLLCAAIGSAMALSAQAHDKIPQQGGFSGYVFLGASANKIESNTSVRGDERLDSLDRSPSSTTEGQLAPAFGLSYTLADSRTQFFGGTELEDFLTQDGTLGLGVRQGFGELGNLRVSLLAGTGSEVWADPYVVGVDRDETDRKSGGVRLGWEHMLESDFDLTFTKRTIKLDDELSGRWLGLNAGEQALLDREGEQKKLDLSYRWSPSADHLIIPTLSYVNHDLDGGAMAMQGSQFELNYAYLGLQDWELVASLLSGSLESDDANPLADKKQELDRFGLSLAATYKEPFGLKGWKARAAYNYGEEDSNIDFYDTSIKSLTMGMMYGF